MIRCLRICILLISCSLFMTFPYDQGLCAQPGRNPKKVVLLHYWTGALSGGIDDMMHVLNQELPGYRVKATGFEHESFKIGIRVMLDGGNPPDLFSYWAGARVQALVDAGHLAPLDEMWRKAELDRFFTAPMLQACTYNGRKYSLPLTQHYVAMFYNKDVFARLGLEPPRTWEEFLQVCAALKGSGIAPIALGARERWPAQFWFDYLLLRGAGPDYRQQLMTGAASYTDPQVLQAFSLWQELLEQEYFNEHTEVLDWSEAAKQVYLGEAAMTLMGTWIIGLFSSQLDWPEGQGYDFFPFPVLDTSIPDVALGPIDVLVASSEGNVAAAEQVLPFFADQALQRTMSSGSGALAPNKLIPNDFYSGFRQKILETVQATPHWAFNYDLATPPVVAEAGLDLFLAFLKNPGKLSALLAETQTRTAAAFREHKR